MIIDIQKIIKQYNLNIQGAIHIGAHHGQEVESYIYNNIKNIICFEPVESSFIVLESLHSEKCDLFQLALGNNNKKIKMNIANNGQSSSILNPKVHLDQYPHIKFETQEEIQMVKLDDFMIFYNSNHKNKNKKFDFINIDVQGYELEVFKGAKDYLNNVMCINAEVNKDFLYENCALVNEIDDYLSQYNFKRVETVWEGNTWGDAFYIKQS